MKYTVKKKRQGGLIIPGKKKNWRGLDFLALLVILMAYLITPSHCRAIDFSADWKNWEFSDEDAIFSQSYSISVAPEATRAVTFGASFRYVNRKQGGETRETITPTLSMDIVNDLFRFNLSGTQTERKDTERSDITNRSWDANLTSECKGYADIRLYVGQSFDRDDAHPRRLDDDTLYYGFHVGKKWHDLEVTYDYRGSDEDDKVEASKTETDQHFFKASYSKSWEKLSVTAEQQFNINRTVTKTRTATGRPVYYPLIVGVTWNPPRPPNGTRLKLNQEFVIDLRDQPVDEIRFYINEPFGEQVPTSVRWDLYESIDGVVWDELRTNITLPFRFIRTYQRRRYLRLVAVEVPIPAPELETPAVRVYLIRPGTGNVETMTIKSESSRTNFSVGYQFTPDLSAHYYFTYDKSSPDPGNDSTNVSHTLSATWYVNRFFEPSINLSRTTRDTETVGKDETTTISLNNISQIYETLQITQGYTHSFGKERGRKSHTTDTFDLTATANLYPDLDLRWNGNLSRTQDYYPSTTTKGIGSSLNLSARMTPDLTVNGIYNVNYTESSRRGEGNTLDHYISIDASWSLSDDLTLHGSEALTISDDGEDTLNSTYSLWVALTPKVQMNFAVVNTRGDENTYNYSAFISWTISPFLTLKSSYDRTEGEGENGWAWMVGLNAYF